MTHRESTGTPEFQRRRAEPAVIGPRDMATNLQLRRSTKQLIKRYESMNNPAVLVPSSRPASSSLGTSAKFFRAIGASKENLPLTRKSPLRQSFSNLLSVFKIGNTKSSDNNGNHAYTHFGSVKGNPHQPASSNVEQEIPKSGPCDKITAQKCLHSGRLLYLSHPQAGQRAPLILPVWTDCTVVLKPGNIYMTWLTTQGNPSAHVISLVSCTDVRSLSLEQLDSSEMALLPTTAHSENIRVFELLFEGRKREKFAATSIQQRAGWVNAIWDAVLPSPGPLGDASNVLSKAVQLNANQSQRNAEQNDVPSCGKAFSHNAERSLPPTPVESDSSTLHQCSPPSDDCDTILLTKSGKVPHSQHASIAYPVKQKPSETTLKVGPSASTALPNSEKSRVSSIVNSGLRGLQYHNSVRSDDSYSIIDSYGDSTSPEMISNDTRYSAGQVLSAEDTLTGCSTSPTPMETRLDISDSPASQYHAASNARDDSFAELLRVQACQITGLGGNLSSILEHLRTFDRRIETLEHATPLLADISQAVKSFYQKADRQGEDIRALFDKVNEIGRQQSSAASYGKAIDPIKTMLEDVWDQSRLQLPRILRVLEDIHAAHLDHQSAESQLVNMQNLRPSSYIQDDAAQSADNSTSHCLPIVEGKLNELLSLCRASKESEPGDDQAHISTDLTTFQQATQELKAVLDILHAEEGRRNLREQQQEDSVRYLNDLNSWLEAFVKANATQMQETALGIRKLCHELGAGAPDSEPSSPGGQRAQTVLGDIRQLIFETRKRQADSVELKQSLDALISLVNAKADLRNGFAPETVMELLHRQRHDQENLLKALTAELSSEIRGERLRFVEAMKEATAINVQSHVEHFKKELNREVMVMTREIERLHREKQAIENKIAELFAFYSKHKQAPSDVLPASHHRILPTPQYSRPIAHREVGYQ